MEEMFIGRKSSNTSTQEQGLIHSGDTIAGFFLKKENDINHNKERSQLKEALEHKGFINGDLALIESSFELSLSIHDKDKRADGEPYSGHILRVMLCVINELNITDPNIIAAAALHDAPENHPKELVFKLKNVDISDATKLDAQIMAAEALSSYINPKVAELVLIVTNPEVGPGENRISVYMKHIKNIVENSPEGLVIKIADILDNGDGDLAQKNEDKQFRADNKYAAVYEEYKLGIRSPNSLITGETREKIDRKLTAYQIRAFSRLIAKRDSVA